MAPRAPWKDESSCVSVLAMFNMLYSSMNQQLFEKKIMDDFCHEKKPSHVYCKINTFRGD